MPQTDDIAGLRTTVTSASATDRVVSLHGDRCVIGRAQDCDVTIDDPSVSRRHAKIVRRDGNYWVEDLSSANGTFVNARRIHVPTRLNEGDQIKVGGARLDVSIPREEVPGASHAPPPLVTVAEATLGAHTQPVRLNPLAEIERLHRKLAVMYRLGEIVAQALEPHVLLQRVVDCVLDVYPQASEAAAILFDEHAHDSMRTVALGRRDSNRTTRSVPIPRDLVDRIVTHGHAVLLRAADRPSLSSNEPARITLMDAARVSITPAGFRMAAPIVFRDEPFGVLHVQADSDLDAFDQADLDLLGGIAGEIAVALRLARLSSQQRVQERIEKDLAIARQIQRNLLPRHPPKITGLDFDVHYEPAFAVGGDFYDFVWLDATHLGVVIGDVSGKAVSGALFMARVASEIRAHAALQREPRRILRRVNRAIADTGDDGVFCTALVMSIDIERQVARFSNAGHTLPLIGRDGKWTPIDDEGARSMPLGIAPDLDVGEVEIALRPGDRVLLYTDGLVEASAENGAFYGEERLREALERADGELRVIRTVLDDVDRFVGGTPQRDDQTLVCMHVTDALLRRMDSAIPPRN